MFLHLADFALSEHRRHKVVKVYSQVIESPLNLLQLIAVILLPKLAVCLFYMFEVGQLTNHSISQKLYLL